MLVTIIWEWNSKQILYWVHELVWNPVIYDISEESICLIRECLTNKVQETIDRIIMDAVKITITK